MFFFFFEKRSEPYVRYTLDEENKCILSKISSSVSTSSNDQKLNVPRTNTSVSRPTARKTMRRNSSMPGPTSSATGQQNHHYHKNTNSITPSTSNSGQNIIPPVKHLNNSTIYVDDENKPKGKVMNIDLLILN